MLFAIVPNFRGKEDQMGQCVRSKWGTTFKEIVMTAINLKQEERNVGATNDHWVPKLASPAIKSLKRTY